MIISGWISNVVLINGLRKFSKAMPHGIQNSGLLKSTGTLDAFHFVGAS